MTANWNPEVYNDLESEAYDQVASFYEQAIQSNPTQLFLYCHLGLSYLLQGQEESAQITWMTPLLEATDAEQAAYFQELGEILENEAKRQQSQNHPDLSWLIRGHLHQLQPDNLENLLELAILSIKQNRLSGDDLQEWQLLDLIKTANITPRLEKLLNQTFQIILELPRIQVTHVELISVILSQLKDSKNLVQILADDIYEDRKIQDNRKYYPDLLCIDLLRLMLEIDPYHVKTLYLITNICHENERHSDVIELAQRLNKVAPDIFLKTQSYSYLLMNQLCEGSQWDEALKTFTDYQEVLNKFVQSELPVLEHSVTSSISFLGSLLPYMQDEAIINRSYHNALGYILQQQVRHYYPGQIKRYEANFIKRRAKKDPHRKLKIGYLSGFLRQHSVGWLARWLIQNHNHDQFHISLYLTGQSDTDFTHQWFIKWADQSYVFLDASIEAICNQIHDDIIDILIDLDSLTSSISMAVLAVKPAPIQASWLGWDTSGLPTIDYFLVDKHVVPANAQEYYQEKLIHLPTTYIAVDGFEIGIPTISRDTLNIPDDAVVYFSGQRGFKRHPDTIRLQMKIIKEVPNSYFLIKGNDTEEGYEKIFEKIATSEGVSLDRLRFLPRAQYESQHRANLQIADVVLDTFPYNGATTTLEVLWLGIPIVTRVGQQFSARNSYGFIMNAGISEGIAWTDEEYVEWGIRFGKDADLRNQVTLNLKRSRITSPLWKSKQFTRDMEEVYQTIWRLYQNDDDQT